MFGIINSKNKINATVVESLIEENKKLRAEFNAINVKVESLIEENKKLRGLMSDLEGLEDTVETLEDTVSDLEGTVECLSTSCDELETAVTAICDDVLIFDEKESKWKLNLK